jgi:hypothetical protein
MVDAGAIGEAIMLIAVIAAFYFGYRWSKKYYKTERQTEKKSDWQKLALIVIGIFAIPIILLSINYNFAGYALLLIPIWVIFVWKILPRIIKRKIVIKVKT